MDVHTILIISLAVAAGIAFGVAGAFWFVKKPPAVVAAIEQRAETDIATLEQNMVDAVLARLTDKTTAQRAIAAAQAEMARRDALGAHVIATLTAAAAPQTGSSA